MHRMPLRIATLATFSALPVAAFADTKPFLEYAISDDLGTDAIAWLTDPDEASAAMVTHRCALKGYVTCKFNRVTFF